MDEGNNEIVEKYKNCKKTERKKCYCSEKVIEKSDSQTFYTNNESLLTTENWIIVLAYMRSE